MTGLALWVFQLALQLLYLLGVGLCLEEVLLLQSLDFQSVMLEVVR